MYTLRAVIQNDDGQYVNTSTLFDGFEWDDYNTARNECVPLIKALAKTLDMVYDNDEEDVWFELIEKRWGAVAWEVRAKDCSTLTILPF